MLAVMFVMLPATALAQVPADSVVISSRTYNPNHPWFVEGSIGGVQPGPDGTDFGSGQNFQVHFGAQTSPWADLSLGFGWVSARDSEDAIDSDITYGWLRPRAWLEAGRFLGYAEGGVGLYRFSVQQQSVLGNVEDDKLRFGGMLGTGVQYVRTKFWVGVGVQVLAAIGSSSLESGDILTITTYNVSVGTPIGR